MKNSTLILRSLFLIFLIAGSAHIVTYASQKNTKKLNTPEDKFLQDSTIQKDKKDSKLEEKEVTSETDYIIGTWKVTYNTKKFNGAILYQMKKEDDKFIAYIKEYQNQKGQSQKAENTKTLIINSFDGYKGKGQYIINYEGEEYDVECTIDMLDLNTFKLSYDYYGYSDIETWKKQ